MSRQVIECVALRASLVWAVLDSQLRRRTVVPASTVDLDPWTSEEPWVGEQLMLCHDEQVGLRAVIAIDDTTLGPGLGGVRFRPYPDVAAAVRESRRLAAAMTLKNAVAELPFGGAKAVIVHHGPVSDRDALFRRFGEFCARAGVYIPGVDMGTTVHDLAMIGAAGVEVSCSEEDPSPWTALGVAAAIRAAVEHVDARSGIDGVRVLVQGAGHVGAALARELAADGAAIVVVDVDAARAAAVAQEVGGETIAAGAALTTPCDVLAPCAIARVVSRETIDGLRCRIIAGGANDMLADPGCADLLAARGIAYVPDFVANAGGVLHIRALREGLGEDQLRAQVRLIGDRAAALLAEAEAGHQTPLAIAEKRARHVIAAARDGERLAA
jgi:leucine dehydrogenase